MTVIDDNVLHYHKLCTEEQVSTSIMFQLAVKKQNCQKSDKYLATSSILCKTIGLQTDNAVLNLGSYNDVHQFRMEEK